MKIDYTFVHLLYFAFSLLAVYSYTFLFHRWSPTCHSAAGDDEGVQDTTASPRSPTERSKWLEGGE